MGLKPKNHDQERVIPYVSVLISVVIVALVVWDLCRPTSRLDISHVILIGLALLPWAGQFLTSFSLSASGLEAEFQELRQEVETVVDAQSEPELPSENAAVSESLVTSEKAMRVLQALTHSKYTLRSWSGVSKDADLSGKAETYVILEDLVDKGFAKKSIGKRSGNDLWSITPDGYRAMMSANN